MAWNDMREPIIAIDACEITLFAQTVCRCKTEQAADKNPNKRSVRFVQLSSAPMLLLSKWGKSKSVTSEQIVMLIVRLEHNVFTSLELSNKWKDGKGN